MKVFNVYKHTTYGAEAVKVGFSWPAFFFDLFWMLYKRLWAWAAIWIAAIISLEFLPVALVANLPNTDATQVIANLVYFSGFLLIWLLPAFKGNKWRETNLLKKGYSLTSTVQAATPEAAIGNSLYQLQHSQQQTQASPNQIVAMNTQAPQLTTTPSNHTAPSHQTNPTSSFEIDEEAIYELVANEVESGNVRKGLWTKLWAELDGDDTKVKLAYVKIRAKEIMNGPALKQNVTKTRQAEEKKERQQLEKAE